MKNPVFVLPRQFDSNEIFVLIAGFIIMFLVLFLPRRLLLAEIIMIWFFNYFLAELADFTLARPPLDLYHFNDTRYYDWFDLILYVFLYPPAAYLFVHCYEKFRFRGKKLLLYILLFAIVTTILEGISAYFGVFTYNGWKTWYSIPVYCFIYYLNLKLFLFVRNSLLKKSQAPKERA
ncbi:hypothetical protein LRR81_07550 [Metabacillus sp. GX 13764]|uniref:hypothetical protein n=1 Tax=Metabacillus kandeliae TaxID=2900151 RepID=UPI001E54C864|nr:hypothetical protein [Metabacillus kandeliae]MCD7034084.1 hypothetical protein [Metabacillus kandeliae]